MAKSTTEIKIMLTGSKEVLENLTKAKSKVTSLTTAADKLNGNFKGKFANSARSINQLSSLYERLKVSYNSSTDTKRMKSYSAMIDTVKGRMTSLEKATESCGNKSNTVFGKLQENFGIGKGFLAVSAAIAVGKGIYNYGSQASDAAAQVEQYGITLKTMLGSTSAARERMNEYFTLAKKTPFELSEVVEAGNKLQALGRYKPENLTMLGDLAAASGKDMGQVMTAYSQLVTGQKGDAQRMFRDLFITKGDWEKYTGKGSTKNGELKASTDEMLAALPKIMEAKGYLGMMSAQSDSTKGKLANLQDASFQLSAAIGERLNPTVNAYADKMGAVIDKVTDYVGIPLENKIAKEKVEVNYLVKSLIDNYKQEDARVRIMSELNQKYPEILKNIDLEKVGTKGLLDELQKVNLEYDKRMKSAIFAEMLEKPESKLKSVQTKLLNNEIAQEAFVQRKNVNDKINKLVPNKYEVSVYDGKLVDRNGFVNYERTYKNQPEKLAEIKSLIAEEQMWADKTNGVAYNKTELENKAKQYRKEIDFYNQKINELMPTPSTDNTTSTTNGNSNSGGSSLGDSVTSVTGSAKQIRNITVNIDSFNKGGINTQNTSLQKMDARQIDDWFVDVCMKAVRNVELSYS
ncbi:MAG: hypothetical protein LBN95_06065 [Prevotellaceae bacterium]|jgi:hypothetical protein|nr:hypothetical protein [Prevotellaceae bacterium]